jgi:hypothetical protein
MERKRNIAIVLAVLAGAALWIEHGNHTAIEASQAAGYHPCPDSDAMPYSMRCIEFMVGPLVQNRPAEAVAN